MPAAAAPSKKKSRQKAPNRETRVSLENRSAPPCFISHSSAVVFASSIEPAAALLRAIVVKNFATLLPAVAAISGMLSLGNPNEAGTRVLREA